MRPTMATLATIRYQPQSMDGARHELTRETPGLHSKSDDLVDHHVRLQHAVLHPQKLSHAPSVNARPTRGQPPTKIVIATAMITSTSALAPKKIYRCPPLAYPT